MTKRRHPHGSLRIAFRWQRLCCSTALCLLSAALAAAQTETFDDGNAAARFSAPLVTLEQSALGPDSTVDYAFDYSTLGIGPAPNATGGTTTGIAFGMNLTNQSGSEGESVGVTSSALPLPTGDYTVNADLYIYLDNNSGTTEEALLGVYHAGPIVPLLDVDNGGGVTFSVNSDGDSFNNADYNRILGPPIDDYDTLGNWEDLPAGTFNNGSTPQNQWVALSISNAAGQLSFKINSVELATYDNAANNFAGGSILIGGSDIFNSSNANNRVIFDNLTVGTEEPGDFNGDGDWDVDDVNGLLAIGPISFGVVVDGSNQQFDLTGDGVINLDDLDDWLDVAAAENGFASAYKLGDSNLDGTVDGQDFLQWNASKFSSSLAWDNGEFNGDGFVDGQDFLAWNANKFTSSDVASVPEPAAVSLLGLAILMILRRRAYFSARYSQEMRPQFGR